MNEQVIQQIIADYAMENANLRVAVATLQAEIKALKKRRVKQFENN